MFEWINKQGVRSETGFIVQRMHRFFYHYIEGERILKIDVESGGDRTQVYVPLEAFWAPPHNEQPISQAELATITKNLHDALEFMGTRHEFVKE